MIESLSKPTVEWNAQNLSSPLGQRLCLARPVLRDSIACIYAENPSIAVPERTSGLRALCRFNGIGWIRWIAGLPISESACSC